MQKDSVYTDKILDEKARRLFANERRIKRLDGWFLIREISEEYESAHPFIPAALRKARALLRVCERIPLSLDENAVFAGTQRDAFAKSYALINPNFKVSTFNGYCDPAAVFRDIEPNEEFTEERIDKVRRLSERSEYVRRLKIVYEEAENDTREAAYFVEPGDGASRARLSPRPAARHARPARGGKCGKRVRGRGKKDRVRGDGYSALLRGSTCKEVRGTCQTAAKNRGRTAQRRTRPPHTHVGKSARARGGEFI